MLFQTCFRRFVYARPATMPLRAKIINPAMAAKYSSTSEIKELPGDEPKDVLFDNIGGVRSITLHRPDKLNSLNGSMIRKIVPRLREWSKSDMANIILIKGKGRAFCAGGDVAALALQNKKGAEGQQESKDYFALEYKLDHLIATYKKPYIALIDGITMGGGVGLSLHAPIRIATENTVFAMPETTIGFFPDVGASFFLPRMDGELGAYFALTSEQLKGADVFYAGVATHYLHSSSLPDLEARLAELEFRDYDSLEHRLRIINSTVEEFSTGLPQDKPIAAPIGGNIRAAIDYCFQPANDIQSILGALQGLVEMDPSEAGAEVIPEWASKTIKTIQKRSPTSVCVTLHQLRESAKWGIGETFRREHGIASRFMEHADFIEGVSALLIDKPKRTPKWSTDSIEQVSKEDVASFFDSEPTLELLGQDAGVAGEDYKEYPHAWIGLPTEAEVQAALREGKGNTINQIVNYFLKQKDGKQGVREKVQEILERKAVTEGGQLSWKR